VDVKEKPAGVTRTPARNEYEQSAADGSAAAVEEPGRGDAEGKGREERRPFGCGRGGGTARRS